MAIVSRAFLFGCSVGNPEMQELSILRLQGKTAIVTGGTSGIGLKVVELFRSQGAAVVFTGRNAEAGGALSQTTGATFVFADASRPDHAPRTVDAALANMGAVDVLVNNAGTQGQAQGIEHLRAELLDEAIAVHLRAPWELMGLVAPIMRERGGGSIVNICSIAAHRVGAASMPYAVSKIALLHLTRYAAAELGNSRIRVNSISPGFIATPKNAGGAETPSAEQGASTSSLERMFKFTSRQALSQIGRTENVAEAVLFLASDESAFVTGTDIVIDGGMVWGQNDLLHS